MGLIQYVSICPSSRSSVGRARLDGLTRWLRERLRHVLNERLMVGLANRMENTWVCEMGDKTGITSVSSWMFWEKQHVQKGGKNEFYESKRNTYWTLTVIETTTTIQERVIGRNSQLKWTVSGDVVNI